MKKRLVILFCGLLCLLIGCERLVFVKNDGGTKHIYRMRYNGNSQPFSPTTGTTFNYPDVSNDGNKIVYTDGQNVFTSDLNDIGGVSQKQLLVPQQGRKANVRWASRHPVVGYANYENGKASIFLSATDDSGANPHRVTYPSGSESDGGGHDFYVDNNVQNIIYSRDGDLYYMFYNGTQPPNRITNTPGTIMETLPVVSHDGQLLAYRLSFKLAHLGTLDYIQVVDIVTWSPRYSILLDPPVVKGTISAIAFSCDDKRLYVAAATASTYASMEIFSVKLDGSDQLQLTENTVFDSNPDAIPTPCP